MALFAFLGIFMQIIELTTKDIRPYARNAKKHTDEQISQIAASIREFGFRQPLVVDQDNVLVIGHGRLLAAKQLGLSEVPCVRADDLTETQISALRLADNRTNESEWDEDILKLELETIELDMSDFGFDLDFTEPEPEEKPEDDRDPSCQHNVFENQVVMQFYTSNYYGIPEMQPTQTTGDKMLRFMDFGECVNPAEYIAHFYYDDYKFIQAWRDPNKYIDKLRKFKAVVSPDFSLYTDFPRALQILSCYRRQWCGAYWQSLGLDVIPDVVWGDKESFAYCFEGIPRRSTVAVSTVGVKKDETWNNKEGDLFKAGYEEMMNRLEPTTILFYGDMIEGLEGNIIRCPSFYEQKRGWLNQKKKERSRGNDI